MTTEGENPWVFNDWEVTRPFAGYGGYYGYPFNFGWNEGNFLFDDRSKDEDGSNYLYNGEYAVYNSNTCNCAGNSECLNNCYTSQSFKYYSNN